MLRISKLTDYSILVMVELCAANQQWLNAQALATRSHLELPTVSKVLKMLAKAGLVESQRGPSGGYRAVGDMQQISIADVITAIEGPIAMTECTVHEGLCSVESSCNARDNWQKVSQAVTRALQAVSLAEMSSSKAAGDLDGNSIRLATVTA